MPLVASFATHGRHRFQVIRLATSGQDGGQVHPVANVGQLLDRSRHASAPPRWIGSHRGSRLPRRHRDRCRASRPRATSPVPQHRLREGKLIPERPAEERQVESAEHPMPVGIVALCPADRSSRFRRFPALSAEPRKQQHLLVQPICLGILDEEVAPVRPPHERSFRPLHRVAHRVRPQAVPGRWPLPPEAPTPPSRGTRPTAGTSAPQVVPAPPLPPSSPGGPRPPPPGRASCRGTGPSIRRGRPSPACRASRRTSRRRHRGWPAAARHPAGPRR